VRAWAIAGVLMASCGTPGTLDVHVAPKGVLLEDLTWQAAEARLTADTVVVIPIGAAAKEHGPHLLLKNDLLLAESFKMRVVAAADVVVAPTVNYHFYPAFVEYPGSTSLRLETARDLIVDICRSLARFGPRRFYALNTGVSTNKALKPAAEVLAAEGILLTYTDLLIEFEAGRGAGAAAGRRDARGRGGDVDDALPGAGDGRHDEGGRPTFSRRSRAGVQPEIRTGTKTYSASGTWGDATLATREKGEAAGARRSSRRCSPTSPRCGRGRCPPWRQRRDGDHFSPRRRSALQLPIRHCAEYTPSWPQPATRYLP
jgi:creatinine amidohydrolase